MRLRFVIEVDSANLSPDDCALLQGEIISTLEYDAASLGITRIRASYTQSHAGYIHASGEHTSDICAPNSPDARYDS
jgi:hypothetical protein